MEQRLEENNVKNENNRKKEYLKGYRTNRRRINRIDDEVTELRELAASVKATDYSGMPHGSGNQKDLSDELARIDTLEKRLEQEREKCVESYISIENIIKAVKDDDENDVLFYRYVKGLRWWEIAEKMDFSELTTPMLNEFVEKILVHEADYSSGERVQEVEIYLNFIGKFELPVKEPTAEEIAEHEKLKARRAKKAEYNRRYMEKRRKRIAGEEQKSKEVTVNG